MPQHGARSFNHLMLSLREDFSAPPVYRNAYRKESFDDYDVSINTLAAPDVLTGNIVTIFDVLKAVRSCCRWPVTLMLTVFS
jgi:hypothetical protein